jgi:hypothetical protein
MLEAVRRPTNISVPWNVAQQHEREVEPIAPTRDAAPAKRRARPYVGFARAAWPGRTGCAVRRLLPSREAVA